MKFSISRLEILHTVKPQQRCFKNAKIISKEAVLINKNKKLDYRFKTILGVK